MARFNKRQPIPLVIQEIRIKKLFPQLIDSIKIEKNQLTALLRLQPSEESIVYHVKIAYKINEGPKAWLINPKELAQVDGKNPHHIYGFDNSGHAMLCVYYPRLKEWNSQMYLADSFIPWVITWLSAYEYWQITGLWLYPESKDTRPKQ